METSLNLFDRFNRWIQESIMVKLFSIGFLLLILLIPLSLVEDLIMERSGRSDQVLEEITSKWSGRQVITGPVLVLPFRKTTVVKRDKDTEIIETIERAYFLPEDLSATGAVTPQVLHRGIFEAAVYESTLEIKSKFSPLDLQSLDLKAEDLIWKDAYLALGISDMRGVRENPVVKLGARDLRTEPSNELGIIYGNQQTSGLIVKLDPRNSGDYQDEISIGLSLKGSHGLKFSPIGKITKVSLKGPWQSPSFDGEFLPDSREISDEGFAAHWSVLHFNRPFAQQWKENTRNLSGADFGVNLLIPVEQYQKSIRSTKYGILVIFLTFIALFLVEISQKVKIHPVQYILIGAALIIYYALLLSFSEQVGYNLSYAIASLATTIMISLYATSFLPNRSMVGLLAGLLLVFYVFIFIIILQQDFSLLIGSIGLFITIGALMFLTRRVSWYGQTTV
jgi:inner membrane protein